MDQQQIDGAVLQALSHACSQDASVLKPAEQQLKEWETQPGFYSSLSVSRFSAVELLRNLWMPNFLRCLATSFDLYFSVFERKRKMLSLN